MSRGGFVAKIVVGIDGSETSRDALLWAIDEARLRKVPVVAVHAWEPPPATPEVIPAPMPPPRVDPVSVMPQIEAAATRLVEDVVEEVAAGASDVEVTAKARQGPAAHVLAEMAQEDDLLVVGSRGRGGFAALVLGSVSQQCAQHAPCPVVIYRRRGEG
jgi:nucleotide-binding universal stress UspA family protein